MTSHLRSIAENISGSGTPVGSAWLRRAVEIWGDPIVDQGSWAKKLFFALGGDLSSAPRGSWMKKLAYLLEAQDYPGSWYAKVATAIEDNGGILLVTFDSTDVTMDSTDLTMDQDV